VETTSFCKTQVIGYYLGFFGQKSSCKTTEVFKTLYVWRMVH
jgi:hypothetical protein